MNPYHSIRLFGVAVLGVALAGAAGSVEAKDKGKGKGPKAGHQMVKRAVKVDARDWDRGASRFAPGRSGNLPPGHGGVPPGQLKKLGREADVQAALARMGYYSGPLDGSIGPRSRAAIIRYQTQRGLAPTGLIDAILLNALGLY